MSRRRKIEQSKDYFKTNDLPSFYTPKIRHHQPKTYWDLKSELEDAEKFEQIV